MFVNKGKAKWIFLVILFLSIVLRTAYIDKSLDGDEVLTSIAAKSSLNEMINFIKTSDAHPPLSYLLLHFWLLLGKGEVWIRILFVIFGVGVVLMTYLIGKEYMNKELAILGMFLVCASPLAIWTSQYVRSYSMGAFFILCSSYFLIRIFNGIKPTILNWIGYALSSVLSIYSFYFSALVLIAQNFFIVFNLKKHRNILKTWVFSQIAIFILFLPWLFSFKNQFRAISFDNEVSTSFGFYFHKLHIGGLARSIAGTVGIDPLFLSDIPISIHWNKFVLLALSIIGTFGFFFIIFNSAKAFKNNENSRKAGIWFFLIMIIVPLSIANLLHNFLGIFISSDYFFLIAVFFLLCIAAWLISFKIKKVAITLLIIFFIFSLTRLRQIYSPMEDWRNLAPYIESRLQHGDCIAFLRTGQLPFRYYVNIQFEEIDFSKYLNQRKDNFVFTGITHQNSLKLKSDLEKYNRIWLLLTHTKLFGGDQFIKEWFKDNLYTESLKRDFKGINLVLYKK